MNIKQWLRAYILRKVKDEDYVDNIRWADVEDEEQMARYALAASRGCCGFFDGEVKAPDGKTYAVGCNYGH